MKVVEADVVRARIAKLILAAHQGSDQLGEITLHAHQRDGVARVRQLLERERGVLLADDVGLGKTFMALAVARDFAAPLVVAPASVRDVWDAAMHRAGVSIRFVSIEALGRGAPEGRHSEWEPDLIIIDEAHHLRSTRTKRFSAARRMCQSAHILLMTATPVQNRLADLRAILSLFLGERAYALSASELAMFVVRRAERDVPPTLPLPKVKPAEWVYIPEDLDCLDRIVALPPPLPPADGYDGGALLTYTMVRQWASSRAALRAALLRRLARAHSLEDALLRGRLPTRLELAAWCYADGTQQLSFPELSAQMTVSDGPALLERVHLHADAVRDLLAWINGTRDLDDARAVALRTLMAKHASQRMVAFSEYAETVVALYRRLAPRFRVVALTHDGGRVAGAKLSRREVLNRFVRPNDNGSQSDRIDLLLTTDVLSEGVSLQQASVVVHLDLPWNPARLEQRVGRLRRLGAARDSIAVYAFAPPAPAERLLRLEERLRQKVSVAAQSLGFAGAILPALASVGPTDAVTPREERIVCALQRWRGVDGPEDDALIVAAAQSSAVAAIGCVRQGTETFLVAVVGDRVTDSRSVIDDLLQSASGGDITIDPLEFGAVLERVNRWLRHREVADVIQVPALHVARSRRSVLRRVDMIARRTPRHTRTDLAPLMRAARGAATATLSAGAERVFDELANATMTDEAWLHAVGEFAALHARAPRSATARLAAVLLLRNDKVH